MSMLDEAFLKAYRKGRPVSGQPAGTARQQPSEPPVAPLGEPARRGAVPAPHLRFDRANGAPASEARPRPSAAPATGPAARQRVLRPMLEVHRFLWPRVIDDLVERSGPSLDAAVRQLAQRSAQGRRVLFVSGTTRGEGRTTMLLALAQVAALRGLRAVLVDLDHEHPDLARQLGIDADTGLEEVCAGQQSLEATLIESVDDGLTLLPLAGEALDSLPESGLAGVLGALRGVFDLVLIDSGPLDSDAAAVDLAASLSGSLIDDALMVTSGGAISSAERRLWSRRLAAARIQRWEIAENFCSSR
jgi:Mrp family chromosome partitioning ATPase